MKKGDKMRALDEKLQRAHVHLNSLRRETQKPIGKDVVAVRGLSLPNTSTGP
jgi:hypothetical protein